MMRGLYAGAQCILIKVLRRTFTLESHLLERPHPDTVSPFQDLGESTVCEAEL